MKPNNNKAYYYYKNSYRLIVLDTWCQQWVRMASYQIAAPPSFDFRQTEEWPKWSRRFQRVRNASGLAQKPEEEQVNMLIYTMGDEGDDILNTLGLSEADRKKYDTVFGKFENYFTARRNVMFERAKFNNRIQQQEESVDNFITSLYSLAENCGYGSLKEEMIRDRLVVGLKDGKLAEKLQLDKSLTLEKAVTQARQTESVKSQQPTLRKTATNEKNPENVDAVRSRWNPRGQPFQPSSSGRNKQPFQKYQQPRRNNFSVIKQGTCGRCGRTPQHPRNQCPANDKFCNTCKRRGHFSRVCRSKTTRVGQVDTSWQPQYKTQPQHEDDAFLGYVSESGKDSMWNIKIKIGNSNLDFKIDSGADVTIIPEILYKEKVHGPLMPPDKILFGPGEIRLPVLGKIRTKLSTAKSQTYQDIYVLKGKGQALLGRPAIEALRILAKVDLAKHEEPKDKSEDPNTKYQREFPTLFQGLGEVKGEYKIRLVDDAVPYVLNTPRRIPLPLMNQVKEELNRMQELKVIATVKEASDWCSPMVVVPKPSGDLRICADLTKLNTSVIRERYMLPTVEHTLGQLTGAKVFSKLDANSGFWQLKLDEESSYLTTFISPFGRFRYLRLPYGISSAPEHFQRRVKEILEGLEGVVCLVDDIVVYGTNQAIHDDRLRKVLHRLQENKVTLNAKKCQFSRKQINFLGQQIDSNGVHPDPGKVKAISEMDPPKNVGELRRFLGMVNQQSKFAPDLAEMTKPLRELLSKKNHWAWNEQQETAFERIKKILTSETVLAFYNLNSETVVTVKTETRGWPV